MLQNLIVFHLLFHRLDTGWYKGRVTYEGKKAVSEKNDCI